MNKSIVSTLSIFVLLCNACGTVESAQSGADTAQTGADTAQGGADIVETLSTPVDDDGSNSAVPETTSGPIIQCVSLCEQVIFEVVNRPEFPFLECVGEYLMAKNLNIEAACPDGPGATVDGCLSCLEAVGSSGEHCQEAQETCQQGSNACEPMCGLLLSGNFTDPFGVCVLEYLSEKQVDVIAACPGDPPNNVDECVSCVDQAGGSELCQFAVELCSNQPPPKQP